MFKLAFLSIGKINFDFELAKRLTSELYSQLLQKGFQVVGIDHVTQNLEELRLIIKDIRDETIDLVVVFQSTFTDNTLILEVANSIDAPILLWAVPEKWDGGRLKLNSLSGINLASHTLHRHNIVYFYVYADPHDEKAYFQLSSIARAGKVRRRLKNKTLALIGETPTGFDTSNYDATKLQSVFGISIRRYDLGEFFKRVRTITSEHTESIKKSLSQKLACLENLDALAVGKTLAVYQAMQDLTKEDGINGIAIRCWPEFFTDLGCAACGALSLTMDDGIACNCEGDVGGMVTQLMLQGLSSQPAVGVDVVGVNAEENCMAIWHCGNAPLSIANPSSLPEAIPHQNRKIPFAMQFAFKPGRVTLGRLTQSESDMKLVVGQGEMLNAPRPFAATSGVLRFDRPALEILEFLMTTGIEHHISFTYGNYEFDLQALAKILHLPVLNL